MTKLFFCMKWGTRYGADYVNRMYRGIARNVTGDFKLVCFTDDATGVRAEVDCRPLPPLDERVPANLANKPWRKLTLWRADVALDLTGQDALVLDLDVVLTGKLDDFFTYEPGKYAVMENPTKLGSDVGNTSVFRLKVGSHPEIYERFAADGEGVYAHEFRIEQELISARLGNGTAARVCGRNADVAKDPFYAGLNEQVFWPAEWVLSFKEHLLPAFPLRWWKDVELPKTARVVIFHGKPDPDEAMEGRWPEKKVWKRIYKHVRPVSWVKENW
jgi:hypothetical protein